MHTQKAPPLNVPGTLNRRTFLRWSAAAAAAPAVSALAVSSGSASEHPRRPAMQRFLNSASHQSIEEATLAELQAALASGALTSRALVEIYLDRISLIDRGGPAINSILEINPDAPDIADRLDQERAAGRVRGPLHGIPILIKDNVDTADRMHTAAGSLALLDARPLQDSFLAMKLREAGAVILGKTNLSEWANFRSTHSSSGWSGRGGQVLNPYALDRTPSGSSSGTAAAVAANLAAIGIGTETDGSIVSPSSRNGVVGIKPTVGLVSRAGIIPISHSQDTAGPIARTVADAATLLGALTGVDPRDEATRESAGKFLADYTTFLDPNGLQGARIGIVREFLFGYSEKSDAIAEAAIKTLRSLGAEIVDPANIPGLKELRAGSSETVVLQTDFKADIATYLATLGPDAPARTLADLITFNNDHADQEMPYFQQEIFLQSETRGSLTDPEYLDALAKNHRLTREEGIDAVMDQYQLDALVAPTQAPATKIDLINGEKFLGSSAGPAAVAGYPHITVPAGFSFGLPIGLSFFGRAYSEPTLIKLAYAFEQATRARRPPQYIAHTYS